MQAANEDEKEKDEDETTLSSSSEEACRACLVCSSTCKSIYFDECTGDDYSCEADYDGDETHFILRKWVKPLIISPFGHCHESCMNDHCDFHTYGKLDKSHPLFAEFWSKHTKPIDDGFEKCPQCKGTDTRISSCLFQSGYFEVRSFKCYVCSEGCVSCYIMMFISGMAASMMNVPDDVFEAREKASRLDLCKKDAEFPQLSAEEDTPLPPPGKKQRKSV